MNVYFIRHKMAGSELYNSKLRKRKQIAFDFVSAEFHEDLKDYSIQSRGLTQTFNAFKRITESGCIIAAEFDDPNVFTVGKILPGTMTRPWNVEYKGDKIIYKTLQFFDSKDFYYADIPILAAIRPPYGTICSPGASYCHIIKHLYLKEPIQFSTNVMHPSSIELMCEAFLRSDLTPKKIRLNYALLRTGKTMPAVDIYGRTQAGERLYA